MTSPSSPAPLPPAQDVDVVIIGAGVSGLSCARALQEHSPGRRVVVIEAHPQAGGYCRTIEQDGFVFDCSGHFFHFRDAATDAWFHQGMAPASIRSVHKRALVRACGVEVDFPFQQSLHQLPPADRDACVEDLQRADGNVVPANASFKQRMRAQLGEAICTRFIEPYNEKLYGVDLDELEAEAMGRFFPHTTYAQAVSAAQGTRPANYNDRFRYPQRGAGAYIDNLLSHLGATKVMLGCPVIHVDTSTRTVHTPAGTWRAQHIVSTIPLPKLMGVCGIPAAPSMRAARVAVFNLGFAHKGRSDVHWMYFADPSVPFYRVGYYDNIHQSERMSLYVEVGVGLAEQANHVDWDALWHKVAPALRAQGIWTSDNHLVTKHQILLDPAYVLMTHASQQAADQVRTHLRAQRVHSIGRYGRWTYCSIEDNIIEARALAATL
jgi:protoporphyrinogen oxidase